VPVFSATSCRPPNRRGDRQFEDITAPIWNQNRSELEDISRSRAMLGLTPAKTATFYSR
jgi:hypothetical protein